MTASGASGSPSIEARLVALAKKALEQTRAGVMEWRTTDDDAAFTFTGTRTSLIIDHFRRNDFYEFRVVNENGTVVEELTRYPSLNRPTNDPWPDPTEEQLRSEFELFAALHDAARRSAFDIDSLLDSAFDDVEDPPDPSEPPPTPSSPRLAPEEPPF